MFQCKLSKETELSPELIKKIIERFRSVETPRLEKLDKYYKTKNDILNRVQTDENLPNNKVAHPYASYITDILTGYFMGEGVSYSSEDPAPAQELQMILEYNDEKDENLELAKDMSIFGSSVELLYLDEEAQIRLKRLDPREVVVVYDDTLNNDILYGIRFYLCEDLLSEKKTYAIEVYTDKEIIRYTSDELINTLTEKDRQEHHFGMCPIVPFLNNEEQIGDFEPVISLIDAYDSMESDSLNDFDYFVDAYLVLSGLQADSDDIAAMKKNRVILLDHDSSAEWLTKGGNDVSVENVKSRLDKDIHKFAKVPDMSDEAFAGNASGVAIKYKTMPMEDVVAIKERKFKKALQRRIELIFTMLGVKATLYDWRAINITFKRNLPVNESEIATMISKLNKIVSKKTLVAQVPFVEDPDEELERLEKENEADPFYDIRLGLNGEDADGEDEEEK